MFKYTISLILFFFSFSVYSQSSFNFYINLNEEETFNVLEKLDLEPLIELNENMIVFMVNEIRESMNANLINFERGINEITYLNQSQYSWLEYLKNFSKYISSSYKGGSIVSTVNKITYKKFYLERNLELIENHKRWKMDQ